MSLWVFVFFFWPLQSVRIDWSFTFVSPKSKWNKKPWVKIKSFWHIAKSLLCNISTRRQFGFFFRSNMFRQELFPLSVFFYSLSLSLLFLSFKQLKSVIITIFYMQIQYPSWAGGEKYFSVQLCTWRSHCAWGSSKPIPLQPARCLKNTRAYTFCYYRSLFYTHSL